MESIVRFLVLTVCMVAATVYGNDIPPRCIQNSVTPVSCNVALADDRLLPHPDDCQLFYYCVNSEQEPICRQCPANLHFNPIKKVCDFPANAGCSVSSPSAYSMSDYEVDEICEGDNPSRPYADLRPNPNDCNKYYVCDWGKAIPMSCPEGLHFGSGRYCTYPEWSGCKDSSAVAARSASYAAAVTCPEQTAMAHLMPDPESCENYYICNWGQPIHMNCPAGLHFNPRLRVCDHKEHARCDN